MRRLAAKLAVPIVAAFRLPGAVYRSIGSEIRIAIVALTLASAGVLVLSAASGTNATPPTTVLPVTSAAVRTDVRVGQSLDATITLAFSTPMNARSVAGSLRIVPPAPVTLTWDAAGSTLSIAPVTTWRPATLHSVTVDAGALAANGAPMSQPVTAAFFTVPSTTATIGVTRPIAKLAAPDTAFEVAFDGPVDPASVAGGLRIEPIVAGHVHRIGRRGIVRYVFVPAAALKPNVTYRVSVDSRVVDAAGAPVVPTSLDVRIADGPTIVRFRPRDGSRGADRTADVSVRFSERMDRSSTRAAIAVTADGVRVAGSIAFAEGDTVAVFDPAAALRAGARIAMTIDGSAMSAAGVPLGTTAVGAFTTEPASDVRSGGKAAVRIARGGSVGAGTWAAVETYYLELMNCTRTGGWVTSSGNCSSPGGRSVAPLRLDAGISSRVSRPYAKLLATRGACNHFIGGSPGDRLRRAGYTSYIWAENIGCRSGNPYSAVLASHLFFQSEKSYRGGHYVNLMNAKYDRAGIGVWVASGRVRLVVDFYHPR